jgi:hypothetical protein
VAGLAGKNAVLRDIGLPNEPAQAGATWFRTLNDAVMDWNHKAGVDIPDLNDVMDRELMTAVNFCFPAFLLVADVEQCRLVSHSPTGSGG